MDKAKQKYKLPEEWIVDTLGNVTIVNMGQSPPSSSYNTKKEGLPFYQGKSEFRDIYPEVRKYCSEPIKIVEANDVLISVRAPIGPTNLVKEKSCIGRGLAGIKAFGGMTGEFILYQLRTLEKELQDKGTGTTFKSISKTNLEKTPFKIPALREQERIVFKIETLFTELDQAEKGLQKAKHQLEIYRSAILKCAFEGKLTEQWRNEHNPKSSEELLKHINEGRQKNYEQETVDWKKALKKWNKEKKKVKKPSKPFFVKLAPLSENIKISNWFMGSFVNSVRNYDADRVALSRTVRKFRKGKYPYYGATEIVDYVDDFIFDGKYLLIGEDGANLLSKTKKLAFIASGKFWVNNHAHVVQPLFGIRIEYLSYYFNSLILNEYISGTAQPKLNQTNLNRIPVPYCSNDEQEKIVEILESRFTLIENLEKSINNSLSDLIILKHTILKKAFEGKLVHQDSSDESAKELLLRIKMEKETYLKEQKKLDKLKPKKKRQMETQKTVLEILKSIDSIDAKELWQKSIHSDDIEAFYAELKDLGDKVFETKEGLNSLLSLKK
ncbi:restriction endonuclease subunit S [Polaribacter vadi]|uniref:restriction endonuclease subunit S n=1 Tax=Polaribacter vadi TaxID=1774273 RepID=UPI0030EC3092|tara:strand:- start:6121 stop:7779 length:1659 start_codon:yes stop_codon:yes gene_type:complete